MQQLEPASLERPRRLRGQTVLPQIHDLEHYRPSTTTELYDQRGRVVGSFALERREVIAYDQFAPVLRQAVLSIEDKSFESHWGINVLRIGGAVIHDLRSHGRAQGASTLTKLPIFSPAG